MSTRILGGLLAAATTLVLAVVVCLPASARLDAETVPGDALPTEFVSSDLPNPIPDAMFREAFLLAGGATEFPITSEPSSQTRKQLASCGPFGSSGTTNETGSTTTPPARHSVLVSKDARIATPSPVQHSVIGSTEASIDELIIRLAELKAKEAEVTELLRAKLQIQQDRLKKLKKLGVTIEEVHSAPSCNAPSPPPTIPSSSSSY